MAKELSNMSTNQVIRLYEAQDRKDYIKKHIGKEICSRRISLGLSQEELAKYLGLTRVAVLNMETGKHGTTADKLWMLCCAFHCQMNDLFPPPEWVEREYEYVEKVVLRPTKIKKKKLKL